MDIVSAKIRSRRMAAVRRSGTAPELVVRQVIVSLRYRPSSRRPRLPGSPDLVLTGQRKAIFVHGCFWHRHGCPRSTMPTSNRQFWREKFVGNVRRDRRVVRQLRRLGWSIAVVWECETRRQNRQRLARRLSRFLRLSAERGRSRIQLAASSL